jgi:hypothetical protein
MIYNILDNTGKIINVIVADQDFVDKNYPGQYQLVGPEPVVNTWVITKVAMISRFTPQEYVGIVGATKTDVEVQAWYDLFQAATVVDLKDQRTISGIESMVPKNLLTQPRAEEILNTPAAPSEVPTV